MFWFILTLTSTASASYLPCDEPYTDFNLPSGCPPGQVLHKNVCRSYFQTRSGGQTCLLSQGLFGTIPLPTDDIICPLSDITSDCNLYRSNTAQCFTFNFPPERQPPCNEYDAQREYDSFKACAGLTDGFPLSGFTFKGGLFPTTFYPAIVSTLQGKCPTGYCPTNADKCIRWGHKKRIVAVGAAPEVFGSADKSTNFNHGESTNVTNAENLDDYLKNSQKVPQRQI